MYYPNNSAASGTSQMMTFSSQGQQPHQQQQQQFQAIPTYTSQQSFLVHQPTPSMYPQPNAQFVPMSIIPQGNQGYVRLTNTPLYANSNNNNNNNNNGNYGNKSEQYPPVSQVPPQQLYHHSRNQFVPVPSEDDRYRKQLIVNYLAPDVTSAELHSLFSRFGPLDGARMIYDRQTSMPRGYGFVYFRYEESAKEAVDTMNGFEFHGKRLRVGYSTNPLNLISSSSPSTAYSQQQRDLIQ